MSFRLTRKEIGSQASTSRMLISTCRLHPGTGGSFLSTPGVAIWPITCPLDFHHANPAVVTAGQKDLHPSLSGPLAYMLCDSQAGGPIQCLLTHVTQLGITLNLGKSCLSPSQQVTFTGIVLDSVTMTASPLSQWASSPLFAEAHG